MNKKTTLDDIGKMLDKFILDERGKRLEYWQPSRDEKIPNASKDWDTRDFHWLGDFIKGQNPI